jgi:hypothetical protein
VLRSFVHISTIPTLPMRPRLTFKNGPNVHSNRITVLSQSDSLVFQTAGEGTTCRLIYSFLLLFITSRLTGQGGLLVPCQQVYDRRANACMLLLVFVTLSHSTHTSPPTVLVATLIDDLYFSLITFFLLLVPSQDH